MENLHTSASEILARIGTALKGEKGADIAESLRSVMKEFKDRVNAHPFQALGTAAALGFVLAKVTQTREQGAASRLIGRGIGSIAAISFLEYVAKSSASPVHPKKTEYH